MESSGERAGDESSQTPSSSTSGNGASPGIFPGRVPLEALDPQIKSIQPGGGFCMRCELAWGYLRRALLKAFRKGYVERMALLRKGTFNPCPFEVLDSRDLKFYQNQGGWYWDPNDDPFESRNRWPFARVGLMELWMISGFFFAIAGIMAWQLTRFPPVWQLLNVIPVFLGLCIVWFFRNPFRNIPQQPGAVVSPADGKIVQIEEQPHNEFIGGPAIQIGIFLSVFNVHINRVPRACRIIGISYHKGKFLNALRPISARENEQLHLRVEETTAPFRRMIVRQIAGAIARRIVCWVKPGDELRSGDQLGMIKLGSRTELVIPQEEGLQILAQIGQHVAAGSSILAQYSQPELTASQSG